MSPRCGCGRVEHALPDGDFLGHDGGMEVLGRFGATISQHHAHEREEHRR